MNPTQIARFTFALKRQAGLTLIESLLVLILMAMAVAAALALQGTSQSTQQTTQLTSDLNALRTSTKQIYYGQGGYGSGSLNEVLINGKKVPTTLSISGAAPARVVNHSMNGTIAVVGAGPHFAITVTNIPTDVCIGLATMNGWDTVRVGSAAARTPPVNPAVASSDCATASHVDLVFTGS